MLEEIEPVLTEYLTRSNIINAAASPAEAFTDLIDLYDFLPLAAEALVIAATRADSFSCTFPSFVLPTTFLR